MILSDTDIKKYLKSGDIVIEPFQEALLKPGSYTFALAPSLFRLQANQEIDSLKGKAQYEEVVITDDGYSIRPGEFLLGSTAEKLSISQNIACRLDARTSLARIGLNVLQGSTFVEPGQTESNETLEISNISPNPIRVYAGMKIVKGIFCSFPAKQA